MASRSPSDPRHPVTASGLPPHAGWTPLRTADGSWTLVHAVHGEACHSRAGAWEEARERYAAACRLAELGQRRSPVRLLDVGTGLGLNLAAALEALAPSGAALEVVSLERERSVIEAALALGAGGIDALERWHRPVRQALAAALAAGPAAEAAGVRLGERSRLFLLLGDARERLAGRPIEGFDAVFLDPFSPRVEPELWAPAFLAALARAMAPGSRLSTYTVALSVRAALAAAGLRVGAGPRVGTKSGGTLASPDLDPPPFDARTARRIERRARALRDPASAG